MEAARLFATVSIAGVNASAAALRGFGGTVNDSQKGLSRLAGGTGQLAGGLVRLGAVAATAAAGGLAAVVRTSMDFEDAFAGVRKTVEGTPEELDKLDKALRTLSTRIPVKYTDLAGIAAEAGALGVATKDIDAFTEAVARTAAATVGLSTDAAAEAFGKLGTIFKLSGSDFDRLGSALVALGNAGASSEGDIIEVTKRFAAAGSEAQLSAAQVLGWSSAIASLGPEAEAAGSSLSRTFNNITKYIGVAGKAATSTGKALVDPLKVQSAQLAVEAATIRLTKAQHAHGASSVAARQATIALQQAQLRLAAAQTGVVEKSTDAASERLAVFARVAGVSVAQFTSMYSKDASGAVDLFLTKLGQLDRFKASAALKEAGIINVRDINAILLMSQHIDVLNKQLGISTGAWDKNSELMSVSEKRFDTLKAKAFEFKNTILVGAAAVGDGMTPALGRLLAKAQQFTQLHMPDFEKSGREIGDAIDKIDWRRVQDGARTFLDVMKTILDVVRKIPPELIAGGAALVGINKASGGLLIQGGANILQGAGEAGIGALQNLVGAKGGALGRVVSGIGAQRVFVTNWPLGFGGGGVLPGVGAGAGGLALSTVLPLAVIASSIVAPTVVGIIQSNANSGIASWASASVANQVAGGASTKDLQQSLDATNKALGDLSNMWGAQLVAGDSITQLEKDKAALERAIALRWDTRSEAHGTPTDLSADTRSEAAGIRNASLAGSVADVTAVAARALTGALGAVGAALAKANAALVRMPRTAAEAIAGITARSQAKYHWASGKPPESWVMGTFGRNLLHTESLILRSHETASQKLAGLRHLQQLAVDGKDWGVARKFKTEIAALERTVAAKKFEANVTAQVNLKVDGVDLANAVVRSHQFGRTAF